MSRVFAITQGNALAAGFAGVAYGPQPITTTLSSAIPAGTAPLSACSFTTPFSQAGGGGSFLTVPLGLTIMVNSLDPRQCSVGGTVNALVTPGTYTFIIGASDSSTPNNTNTKTFSVLVQAGFRFSLPTPFTLGATTQGRNFGPVTFTTTGGTTGVANLSACSTSAAPAGVTINFTISGRNCILSGTVSATAAPATVAITFTARDPGNPSAIPPTPAPPAATVTVNITITASLSITTASPLAAGTEQQAFSQAFANTGGNSTFAWSVTAGTFTGNVGNVGSPCQGLTLSAAGVLSGTPVVPGTCGPFTVRVDDSDTNSTNALAPPATVLMTGKSFTTAAISVTIQPFMITTLTVVDGITTRNYTASLDTSATGTNIPLPASNGCTISAGALPAGLGIQVDPGNTARCQFFSAGGSITAAAGAFNFTVQIRGAAGTGTTAQPTATRAFTLTVRNDYTNTTAALADGVDGRSYGILPLNAFETMTLGLVAVAGASDVGQAAEVGNGPLASCTLTGVTPGNPNLTSVVDATANRCRVQSSANLAQNPVNNVPYMVTIDATDTPINDPVSGSVAVPARTVSKTLAMNVQAAITFALNLDPLPVANNAPDAVIGRTYGAPARTSLIFTASGGLSSTAGLSVVVGGSLPVNVACGPTGLQPAAAMVVVTCDSANANVGGVAGAPNFTITFGDAGNTATPLGATSTDLAGHASHTIPVQNGILVQMVNVGTLTDLPDAVQLRTYGDPGSTCNGPACTAVIYTASGGLGTAATAGSYVFSTVQGLIAPGAGFPSPIACTTGGAGSANLFTCSTGAAVIPTAPIPTIAGLYTPSVTVSDLANATTPANTSPAFGRNLTLNAPLAASVTQNGVTVATPGTLTLLEAVNGRTYGVVGVAPTTGAGTPTYSGANGLGSASYRWCVSVGTAVIGTNSFTGINTTCTAAGSTLAASPILTSASVAGVAAGASTTISPITVLLGDAGNLAVPDAFTVGQTSPVDASLTINGALVATLTQTGNTPVTNPGTLFPAVNGRDYGMTGNGAAGFPATPTYSASGGLSASYQWCISAGTAVIGTHNFAGPSTTCGLGSSTVTASPTLTSGNVMGVAPGGSTTIMPVSFQLDDAGNVAVPNSFSVGGASATRSANLTISGALVNTSTQAAATNPPIFLTTIVNRSYGTVGNLTAGSPAAPTWTPTGGTGVGTYEWCISSGTTIVTTHLFAGISTNCAAGSRTMANSVTLTAGNVSGPAVGALAVTVDLFDAGNPAVPAGGPVNPPLGGGANGFGIQPALTASVTQNAVTVASPGTLTLADAVAGRSYGQTGVAGQATYTGTGGAGSTSFRWCISAGTAVIGTHNFSGISTTCTAGGATAGASPILQASGVVTGVAAGASTSITPITVQLGDTGNAAVPDAFTAGQTSPVDANLTINGALLATLTQTGNPGGAPAGTNPAALLTAVNGRDYGITGNGAAGSPGTPTYAGAGGLGAANYRWCISAGTAVSTTHNFTSISITCTLVGATAAGSVSLTSAAVMGVAAGGTTTISPVTVQLHDPGNVAVQDSFTAGTPGPRSANLTINGALQATLTQGGNATPNTALHRASVARSYGTVGNGAAGSPGTPTWTGAGGVGSNLWCISAGSTIVTTNGFTGLQDCVTATTPGASVTLTAPGPVGVTGVATAINPLSILLNDPGNPAVPASTGATSDTNSTQINIDDELVNTLTQTGNAGSPNPATLLNAVSGAAYGGAGTPTYTATGGLSGATFTWCVTVGGSALFGRTFTGIDGINAGGTCSGATTGGSTSFSSAGVTGGAGSVSVITVRLDDGGNAAVPRTGTNSIRSAGPVPGPGLTIGAALGMNLTQTGNAGSPNPANLLGGVDGRTYGQIGGAPTYTATGGTGSFQFCVTAGDATLTARNITMNDSASTDQPIQTTCSTSTIVNSPMTLKSNSAGNLTGTNVATSFTVEVRDPGNTAVGASTFPRSTMLTAKGGLAFTSTPANPLDDAVNGRRWGDATQLTCAGPAACAPAVYTANSATGAGTYVFTAPPTSASPGFGNLPSGFACASAATTLTCRALGGGVTGAAGQYFNFPVSLDDTGNAAVENSVAAFQTQTVSHNIEVFAALALTSTSPLPSAINQVAYTGQLTATGGLSPLTFATTGFSPLGNANNQTCGDGTPLPMLMPDGSLTLTPDNNGTCTVQGVTVTDTANAAVISATTAGGVNLDIPISNATTLAITNTALLNGLLSSAYNQTIANSGGTGPFTFHTAAALGTDCVAAVVGAAGLPAGLSINTGTGAITGTPTTPGTSSFLVCVEDSTMGRFRTKLFTIVVHATKGYVTNAGTGDVTVFNTTSNTPTATKAVFGIPQGVAVTPAGDRAYEASQSSNDTSFLDTLTDNVFFATGTANSASGIAITRDGTRAIIVGVSGAGSPATVVDIPAHTTTTVLDPSAFLVAPNAVALSPDGTTAWIADPGASAVVQVNMTLATPTAVTSTAVAPFPLGIAVSPDNRFVYVTSAASNTVTVLDATTGAVITTVGSFTGLAPRGVTFSLDGTLAYVANNIGPPPNVSVIRVDPIVSVGPATAPAHTEIATLSNVALLAPRAVELNALGSRLYVTDNISGTVAVFNVPANAFNATFGGGLLSPTHEQGIATIPDPNLRITTTSLPAANSTMAVPYSASVVARGGVGTLTWDIVSADFTLVLGVWTGNVGTNCQGFTMPQATGIFAGTAVAVMGMSCGPFTVTVTDSATVPNVRTSGALTIFIF